MPGPYKYEGGNRNFRLIITIEDPKKWDMWENSKSIFTGYFKEVFKLAIYDVNKYLIRATPLRSGRLRGGWTSFLDKHSIDYSAAFMDTTLVEGNNSVISQEAIREGKALSSFVETDFSVSIANAVEYADYVETGTSKMEGRNFTLKSVYKAELIIKNYIEEWLKKCSEKSEIVKPEQMEEVQV